MDGVAGGWGSVCGGWNGSGGLEMKSEMFIARLVVGVAMLSGRGKVSGADLGGILHSGGRCFDLCFTVVGLAL